MPPQTLHIVTLSICIFTLILATAALMPQLKRAMVLMRDAMLMSALVLGLSFAGFLGWGKVFQAREQRLQKAAEQDGTFGMGDLFEPVNQEELDPLPLPSIEDELSAQQLRVETRGAGLSRRASQRSQFSANRSSAAMQASTNRQANDPGGPVWGQ